MKLRMIRDGAYWSLIDANGARIVAFESYQVCSNILESRPNDFSECAEVFKALTNRRNM